MTKIKSKLGPIIGAIVIAAGAYCIIGAPSASAEGITWADTQRSSTTQLVTSLATETSAPDYVPDEPTPDTATPPPASPDTEAPADTLAVTGVESSPLVLGGLALLSLGLVAALRKRMADAS